MLRLEAIVPPDSARMEALADRLRLSGHERKRLREWAFAELPAEDTSEGGLAKQLYRGPGDGVRDRIVLALAGASGVDAGEPARMQAHAVRLAQLRFAETWEKPGFPLGGKDLGTIGIEAGPGMGRLLGQLEDDWVSSGFKLDRDALLALAQQRAGKG